MTIIETAKVTSKGQVTIPTNVRKMLNLKEGASLAFGLTKDGIVLLPCKIIAESPYTQKEWKKIERIASSKGIYCANAKDAKRHIEAL